jgi:hypothetical protein
VVKWQRYIFAIRLKYSSCAGVDVGRPRLHDGDKAIILRIDKRLLRLIDAKAEDEGIPRNTIITRELARWAASIPPVSDINNQGVDPEGM